MNDYIFITTCLALSSFLELEKDDTYEIFLELEKDDTYEIF